MKVLRTVIEPVARNDGCNSTIVPEPDDLHKSNDIQDLLKAHSCIKSNASLANRIRCPGISEILPCLYLCGAGVAIPIFLNKLGITCVINAAPELGDTPLSMPDDSKPLYLQIPVLDKGDINIGAYFDEVADLIEEVRAMDGKCMVHCVAGVSRSASLCLAYLMKHMKMTLKSAYELVKAVRPQIHPNTGFIRQLIAYEEKLYQKTSVSMVFKESLGQEIPDIYESEYHAIEQFYQKHRHLKLR